MTFMNSIPVPIMSAPIDAPSVGDRPTRLSESPLWQAQRDFFVKQGIEAWRQNIVPSHVTCNSFIAHAYVEAFGDSTPVRRLRARRNY